MRRLDTDEFWVVGDWLGRVFARWELKDGLGGTGEFVDCRDPAEAERYKTYRQARAFILHSPAMKRWKGAQRDPKAVRPLRCRVQVRVYRPGERP